MSNVQRFEVEPSKAASQFQKLPTVVRDILRLCDGRRTVEAICASSPLDGDGTLEVLRRLGELGVVVARSRPRKGHTASSRKVTAWLDGDAKPAPPRDQPRATSFAPPPAVVAQEPVAPPVRPAAPTATTRVVTIDLAEFSADEERFFASTIDHLVED